MRQCSYCGTEHPDDATQCRICQKPLMEPDEVSTTTRTPYVMSREEKRFWERMTFREFAILFIRLQAIWMFFYAVMDMTYLPGYFTRFFQASSVHDWSEESKRNLLLMLLRIALHVVAGVLAIQKAEPIVSWFVKDMVRQEPADRPKSE